MCLRTHGQESTVGGYPLRAVDGRHAYYLCSSTDHLVPDPARPLKSDPWIVLFAFTEVHTVRLDPKGNSSAFPVPGKFPVMAVVRQGGGGQVSRGPKRISN